MKSSIYRSLDREARDWWYHKKLRDMGKHVEARKRERQSIKSDLTMLREALSTKDAHVTCGGGGTSVRLKNKTVTWPGSIEHWPTAAILVEKLGIPVIDLRTMPNIVEAVRFPMCSPGYIDDDPYINDRGDPGAMAYVDLVTYARVAQKYGATVRNLDLEKD